jgi:hypothetical protein
MSPLSLHCNKLKRLCSNAYTHDHIEPYPICYIMLYVHYWLVVSTPLKNMSQLGLLFPIYRKIKHVPNISKPPTSDPCLSPFLMVKLVKSLHPSSGRLHLPEVSHGCIEVTASTGDKSWKIAPCSQGAVMAAVISG